jgi:sarcosine oxidase, subunit alpha
VPTIDFEGQPVRVEDGDTIASALYRSGVRTFTRSLKYHRRRGLYCVTGDCPNCLMTVDGEPGVRACVTEACEGQAVERESGWPSTDRDVLSVTDRAHRLMPVGFYYKTFIRPRFAWELAERVIRAATGVGSLPTDRAPQMKPSRHVHTDVLVIGGGVAGLSAAKAAAARDEHVLLVDEGRIGDAIPPGPARDRIDALRAELDGAARVEVRERHVAIGVYEGPLVPVVGPDELLEVEPERVVVATGAAESHVVFPGNELPGVWLGRGAARMAGVHRVAPGSSAVVVTETAEGLGHAVTLRAAGVRIEALVVPDALADDAPAGMPVLRGARVVAAEGTKRLRGVVLGTAQGERRVGCDALVLSVGLAPRDGLLRMGDDLPIVGAGDVVAPGCTPEEAAESGAAAGAGDTSIPREPRPVPMGRGGYVCLCEDVGVKDLEQAWEEGWRSSEILKRYTTATMGPCQGAMCGRHLAAFVRQGSGSETAGARTTSRPPARTVALEDLAGGINEVIEKRTALHETHRAAGAHLDWSGSWVRPYRYGDPQEEYRAVRERVSLMDVGTLGKFLVGGRDATELLDRVLPCRIQGLRPGRSRYFLALDEAGYVMDDGLVCALGDNRFYLTSTSGGADTMEAWLRNWTDRWDLHVPLVNQTAMYGAINVAGPWARDLLSRLTDDPIDAAALPSNGHAEITVAAVPCRAIRAGFVGELSFELHHARSRGVELWTSLMEAGRDLDIRPHGLDALDMLRLEKGHIYLGQDTLPDDHPEKLNLGWTVATDKPAFVGKVALERMAAFPRDRGLVGLRFDAEPQRGAPLYAEERIVGRITSCARSEALQAWIGLGWVRAVDGELPSALRSGEVGATVVPTPFYDPEGARLRA